MVGVAFDLGFGVVLVRGAEKLRPRQLEYDQEQVAKNRTFRFNAGSKLFASKHRQKLADTSPSGGGARRTRQLSASQLARALVAAQGQSDGHCAAVLERDATYHRFSRLLDS